jgi:hypothetical protein
MCFLLSTQRTPSNERHCQASNNATPNEDRIRIQRSRRRRLGDHTAFLLYRVCNEIEIPHPGPGCQVKVGITDLEVDYLEVGGDSGSSSGSGSGNNGRPTSWPLGIALQIAATLARNLQSE